MAVGTNSSTIKVGDIMRQTFIEVHPELTLQEVAQLLPT
jgi:Mg/Co/Ni transporter MgtE